MEQMPLEQHSEEEREPEQSQNHCGRPSAFIGWGEDCRQKLDKAGNEQAADKGTGVKPVL